MELETFEWCDYWWAHAEQRDKPRILLIGDSVTRDYRPYVAELLEGRAYVDMLASSRALDNPDLKQELAHLFENKAPYQIIHFNNGLHGWHLETEAYEREYLKMLEFLQNAARTARLAVATSTPVYEKDAGYDNEKNQAVIRRNEAAKRAAVRLGLPVNDIYSAVIGAEEYRLPDGIHYKAAGSRRQAELVYDLLCSVQGWQS